MLENIDHIRQSLVYRKSKAGQAKVRGLEKINIRTRILYYERWLKEL